MDKLPKVGIGVLIINKASEILLGLRKSQHGEGLWGPPGGHLELMESFEDCAIREAYEETGLIIETPKFFALTNDAYEEEGKHYISIFMIARLLNNQQVINREPDNFKKWQWFSPNHLPSNLFLPLKQLVNDKAYGRKLSEVLSYEKL